MAAGVALGDISDVNAVDGKTHTPPPTDDDNDDDDGGGGDD